MYYNHDSCQTHVQHIQEENYTFPMLFTVEGSLALIDCPTFKEYKYQSTVYSRIPKVSLLLPKKRGKPGTGEWQ